MKNNIYKKPSKRVVKDKGWRSEFSERMSKVSRVVGERPELPDYLPSGSWSDQALRVLKERYLDKDDSGKIIETADEMVWRVAFAVASAEALWGESKERVLEQATKFYRLMVGGKFLPNSPKHDLDGFIVSGSPFSQSARISSFKSSTLTSSTQPKLKPVIVGALLGL